MKIDSYRANLDPAEKNERTENIKRVEADRLDRATTADRRADGVRLSSEAQLAAKALAQASRSTGVRTEAIEPAKQLLASGELGKDPERLADAIINRALEASA
jgi:flagellar biosynthesis anti-sigma factor FlgM